MRELFNINLMGLHLLLAILASVVGQGTFVEIAGDLFCAKTRSLGFSLSFIIPAAFIVGSISFAWSYVFYKTGLS